VRHPILIIFILYAIALTIALSRKAPHRKIDKPISRGWGNHLRILVIGATGGTGRELVRQALELGHEVTALVRNPARLKIDNPNLRIVKGNVLDYAAVESAMRGQNAVLCALGHKRWFYPNKILSNGTGNILRAMKTCDVPRLIAPVAIVLTSSSEKPIHQMRGWNALSSTRWQTDAALPPNFPFSRRRIDKIFENFLATLPRA